MKWLFVTLLGLNLIVFAGMIASKIMLKDAKPNTAQVAAPQPPQVIIYTSDLPANTASNVVVAKGNNAAPTTPTTSNNTPTPKPAPTPKPTPSAQAERRVPQVAQRDESVGQAKANYKNCSARVSMPEDDYHRIKGLLSKYPHAASRQVVEGGENGAQSSSRMNVLFMSVSDQDAGAIQAVVGRYGQLNRAPCNK